MSYVHVEIKAKCDYLDKIKGILQSQGAESKGIDHQIDTYFRVNSGRLKLREGIIENGLIYYERKNKAEPKQSNVVLFKSEPGSPLKEILTKSLEVLVVVDKQREIYFIENVNFHLDQVEGLGNFVEIEARSLDDNIATEKLLAQCEFYLNAFKIKKKELIPCSYSDLLLKKKNAQ